MLKSGITNRLISPLFVFSVLWHMHISLKKNVVNLSHLKVGIMVGYAPQGYRLLDIESEPVFLGHNVTVDESKLYRDIIADIKVSCSSEHIRNFEKVETPTDKSEEAKRTPKPSTSLPTCLRRNVRLPEYLKDYEVPIEYCEALLSECTQVESVLNK